MREPGLSPAGTHIHSLIIKLKMKPTKIPGDHSLTPQLPAAFYHTSAAAFFFEPTQWEQQDAWKRVPSPCEGASMPRTRTRARARQKQSQNLANTSVLAVASHADDARGVGKKSREQAHRIFVI